MKKLMFGAAALAACASFGEVASQNVVGYLEATIPGGGTKLLTPSFADMSEDVYNLDDFVVDGSEDAQTMALVLNSNGQLDKTCYWFNEFGSLPAGWFTDNAGAEAANVTLASGEGAFFSTDTQTDVTVRSSGNVPSEITHTIPGFAILGNGSPTDLEIDMVTITGSEDGQTMIQTLDSNGLVDGTYYWFNEYGSLPAGWFKDNAGAEAAGITLEAGDAAIFTSDDASGSVTMTVPSALE